MHCASCVGKLKRSIAKVLPPDSEVSISLATQQAVVLTDTESLKHVPQAVRAAGCDVDHCYSSSYGLPGTRNNSIIAGVSSAMAHLLGSSFMSSLFTIPALYAGRDIFRNIRGGGMDTLVGLGAGASYVSGVIAYLLPSTIDLMHGPQAGSMVLAFVLTGRYIEQRQRERAREGLADLDQLPSIVKVRIFDESNNIQVVERSIDSLKLGDRILVAQGSRFPCDGIIVEGCTESDESLLTGEDTPVVKKTGNSVIAGSLNLSAPVEVEAVEVGSQTLLSAIQRRVEEAQNSKASIQRLVDRVSNVFIHGVLGVAGTSAVAWYLMSGFAEALHHSLGVLLVACPCALGLATPVAIQVASVTGAKHGFLYRDAQVLERLETIRHVVLDKTGTLTTNPVVSDFYVQDTFHQYTEQELKEIACALAERSSHPASIAVTSYLASSDHSATKVIDVKETPGIGMSGYDNNRFVELKRPSKSHDNENESVELYIDAQLAGSFILQTQLRPGVEDVVLNMQKQGLQVHIASGDSEQNVEKVAARLGIGSWNYNMAPEDKGQYIRQLRSVAFVGDGINDGPALAAADVGISMEAGSALSQYASDVVLMNNDLRGVLQSVELAKATRKVIKQNLVCSFAFNAVAIPFAAVYGIPPHVAAAMMSASSLAVVGNSLRLSKFSAK